MNKEIEVANVILRNSLSEILLLQRSQFLSHSYKWGTPGGMIDEKEDPMQAAIRELEEETGVTNSEIDVFTKSKYLIEAPSQTIIIYNIGATLLSRSVDVIIDPREHVDYRWFSQNEVYGSSELLDCLPTMVADMLSPGLKITDLTIRPTVTIEKLSAN